MPAGGAVKVSVSLDGETFQEAASQETSGESRVDLTEVFERRHRGLIAIDVTGEAAVTELKTATWFQLAPNA